MKLTNERIIIFVLVVLLIWCCFAIVRLENYHHANQVGLCSEFKLPEESAERDACLNDSETRTSSLYSLLYGLQVF